jgi:hypothetical protein
MTASRNASIDKPLRSRTMLKMNYWDAKWDLDVEVCPCDVHFNDWVAKQKLQNKLIYHFGTGTHHVVGIRQATNKSRQHGLRDHGLEGGIRFVHRTFDRKAQVSKNYLAYFGTSI